MGAVQRRALLLCGLSVPASGCAHFVLSRKPLEPWADVRVVSSRLVVKTRGVSIDAATRTGQIRFDARERGRCTASRRVRTSNGTGLALDIVGPLSLLAIGLAIVGGSSGSSQECQASGGCQAGLVVAGSGLLWGIGVMYWGKGYRSSTSSEESPVLPCDHFNQDGRLLEAVKVSAEPWMKEEILRRGIVDFEVRGIPLETLKSPTTLTIRTPHSATTLDLSKAFSHLLGAHAAKAPIPPAGKAASKP